MKDALLGLKRKEELVKINDEVEVLVKELSAGEASDYMESMVNIVNGKAIPKTKDAQVKLVMLACYEPTGEKMFSKADIEQIRQLPSSVIDKLYEVADRINSAKVDSKN